MLHVKKSRLNYGELLAPPQGFVLTKAVGTSYSLDLYALLAIPVAMFYAKSMEGDFQQNRYDVLDAIRQSKEKIDLFCQKGKILVPSKYSNLLAFMEDCITEVSPPQFNASFHPKIWLLSFEKEQEILYRVVVLSRNLTFDRSWDIAYFAEGKPTSQQNPQSKKLNQYLQYFYSRTQREPDANFFQQLNTVAFDTTKEFDGFDFHPILGFDNQIKNFPNPLEIATFEELLIISPFLDKTSLSKLKKNSKKVYLLSRKEELDKLSKKHPNILDNIEKSYCINPIAVDGESYIDSEGLEPLSQNLHAKIFIGQHEGVTDWYLGSANCSDPAFTRNAEFLIQLSSTQHSASLANIRRLLFEEQTTIFSPYTFSDIEENPEEDMAQVFRKLNFQLANTPFIGILSKNANNENYDLTITAKMPPFEGDQFQIKASLIHKQDKSQNLVFGQENSLYFTNIAITNLSRFLVLKIFFKKKKHDSLIVKISLDIPEEREDSIFNDLINSKLKFFQYLQFLLSPDQFNNILEILDTDQSSRGEEEGLGHVLDIDAPIYEYLMLAAARSPRKLIEIDKIVTRIQKTNIEIVKDFLPIWNVFKEFANV